MTPINAWMGDHQSTLNVLRLDQCTDMSAYHHRNGADELCWSKLLRIATRVT